MKPEKPILKEAEKWLEEANQIAKKGKYTAAIEALQKAIPIFEAHKDWEKCVISLGKWSEYLARSGQIEATIAKGLEALAFSREKLGELSQRTANCLSNLGIGYKNKGDYEKALTYYHKASKIMLQFEDNSFILANIYNNLGIVYEDLGNYDESIDYHEQSLAINLHLFGESHPKTASSLNNLGSVYSGKGDIEKSIDYHKRSLKIKLQTLGEMHPSTANSFHNLGIRFWSKGDYKKTIDYYHKSLHIRLQLFGKLHPNTATSLNTLGVVHHTKEEFDTAIDYYEQSLKIRLEVLGNVHPDVGDSFNNLGAVYLQKGNPDKAIEYHQKSLDIRLQVVGKTHFQTAKNLSNLGIAYGAKGEDEKAIDYLSQALSIYLQTLGNTHPITANNYLELAKVFSRKNQFQNALKHYQLALKSLCPDFTAINPYTNPPLSNCLSYPILLSVLKSKTHTFYLQYLHKTQNVKDLLAAYQTYHFATQVVTHIRQSYQSEGSKFTLAQKATEIYDHAIEVALKVAQEYEKKEGKIHTAHQELQNISPNHTFPKAQNAKALAFTYAEQSKSILLLSNIKDTEAKAAANIPKNWLQKEYKLRIELNYLNNSINKEQSKGEQSNPTQILEWQSQYFDYQQKYDQLIEGFEADYPEYYRLKYEVKTTSIGELQTDLKTDSLLISYHLSTSHLYTFTLTKDHYEVHQTELPQDFDDLLADHLFYIESLDQSMYIETARQLYQLLLSPIFSLFQGKTKKETIQKLIFIPHAQLLYLPFESLLTKEVSPNTPYSELPYLIQKFAVSYHYSATLFHHSLHQKKTESLEANKSFIGFAPIYADASAIADATHSPSSSHIPSTKQYTAETTRSVTLHGKKYCELIYSEKEVQQVAKIFEKHGHTSQTLFHDEASKKHFFQQIKEYQYVLVAAHGIRNDKQPELSGIIFSPTIENSEEDNSLMYLSDAYHLQLNADLVVLSCCESGVGELAKGEGMMAMNRGFLYAGAKNILFTLFKVYDKASSKLTQALFEGIVGQNLTYSEALQRAKLELIQQKGFTPKAWAGYVLIGS